MSKLLSKPEYERQTAATRDARMAWWREARFGMFVHYGLYSQLGRHEWAMSIENFPVDEYARLADQFKPKERAPYAWIDLAKKAGMKYVVLTTRHHEGFSLWDSTANPYNSVRHGGRDVVREFVDACREAGLRIGFYSSLMDWHHPDGANCAFDDHARRRFLDYIEALNTELLTRYGKIDILWYDVSAPMTSWEGWDSVARNQRMRALQPEIIINNRSRLDEDFGTPEGHVKAEDRDWEACMTFNDLSWGYLDSEQAKPYSYNAQRILRMLATAANGSGNLLLNIGPSPDGSVPAEAIEPLQSVGRWLERNGEAVYGKKDRVNGWVSGSGLCSRSGNGKTQYLWNWIWPGSGGMNIGGYRGKLVSARILDGGQPLEFTQDGDRIFLRNLPERSPDPILGVAVIVLEFAEPPVFNAFPAFGQLHAGEVL